MLLYRNEEKIFSTIFKWNSGNFTTSGRFVFILYMYIFGQVVSVNPDQPVPSGFKLTLYIPVNNFSVLLGCFTGLNLY